MSYTNFDKVAAVNGFGVGPSGSEITVISPTGQLYQSGTLLTRTAAQLNTAATVLAGGSGVESGASSVVIAVAGTAVPTTVTFAVPFATIPNVSVCITTSTGDAGYNNIRASAISTTAVTFTGNSYLAQTLGFNWIAIG